MRTVLSPDNPHTVDRSGIAWEWSPAGGAAHLDFGCYDGTFLNSLRIKGIQKLVGVDISSEAVAMAREKFPDLDVRHIEKTVPLPFPDGTFTSITIMDVLEHVVEQKELLDEFCRILADDGVLIVTVPGRHFFSWLDLGNLKFRFPRLHRWHYCRKHSRAEYEYRYVSNPDGLVGDISAEKRWHEHFNRSYLRQLLAQSGLAADEFDGTAFFGRLIRVVELGGNRISVLRAMLRRVRALDARMFESMNLFCRARKMGVAPDRAAAASSAGAGR